jgi:hypothetical protein
MNDMDVRTLAGVASILSADLRRLTKRAVELIDDPALVNDSELEHSLELLLDRLCFSVQMTKPVGLATWAAREGNRIGAGRAAEIAAVATHAIATEAKRFTVDHGRMLAFLEVLKSESRFSPCWVNAMPRLAATPKQRVSGRNALPGR